MRRRRTDRCAAQRTAFTLVELLAVVTIIVVLLAILLPSLDGAVRHAQRAACASNLDQIGTALLSYLGDHKARFPDKRFSMYSWVGKKGSIYLTTYGADVRVLNQYMGHFDEDDEVPIAECPNDAGAEYGGGSASSYEAQGASYGSNTHTGVPSLVDSSGNGLRLGQVRSASRMVGLAENPAFASAWWTIAQWSANAHPGMYWHDDTSRWNLAFVDGHVDFTDVPNPELTGIDYTFDRTR